MYNKTYMQRAGANCREEAEVGSAERHTMYGNGDVAVYRFKTTNEPYKIRLASQRYEMCVRRWFPYVAKAADSRFSVNFPLRLMFRVCDHR
jgi:hypothetical protein